MRRESDLLSELKLTWFSMHHGWAAARADLNDAENKKQCKHSLCSGNGADAAQMRMCTVDWLGSSRQTCRFLIIADERTCG